MELVNPHFISLIDPRRARCVAGSEIDRTELVTVKAMHGEAKCTLHYWSCNLQLYLQANRSMHAVVAAHEEYIRPWNINVRRILIWKKVQTL